MHWTIYILNRYDYIYNDCKKEKRKGVIIAMSIEEKLKRQMGYIGEDDVYRVGVAYGWSLPVVIKDYYGERELMTIEQLINLPKSKKDDIREAFITSEQYAKLFT
jgi:hypothetical protein